MRPCDYGVWRFKYSATEAERIHEGMDSELTGRYKVVEREWLCVAPSSEMAELLFNQQMTRSGQKNILYGIVHLGQCSAMIFLQ